MKQYDLWQVSPRKTKFRKPPGRENRVQETKVHKEEVAKSERRGSLKGWEADEPVPNNKTHTMAVNRLEQHTRKSKHKT